MPPRLAFLRSLLQTQGRTPFRIPRLGLPRVSETVFNRTTRRSYRIPMQKGNVKYVIETGPPEPPPPRRHRPPLQQAWATKPGFRYTVYSIGGGIFIFYVWNLEQVPVSGRTRFNCVSTETESLMAQEGYKQVMAEYRGHFVSPYSRASARVRRVAERLIAVSGMSDLDWEVHLIASPTANAFVLPGGKIFVFTGILNLAQTDSQLAAVISHEIAHTLAHHMAERLSSYYLVFGTIWTVCLFLGIHVGIGNVLADATILKPSSRKQESEADYIGLRLLAQACYDPEGALDFWANMRRLELRSGGNEVPGFLSTHPATENRIQKIQEWMSEALDVKAQSDCAQTDSMAEEFRRVFGVWRW